MNIEDKQFPFTVPTSEIVPVFVVDYNKSSGSEPNPDEAKYLEDLRNKLLTGLQVPTELVKNDHLNNHTIQSSLNDLKFTTLKNRGNK